MKGIRLLWILVLMAGRLGAQTTIVADTVMGSGNTWTFQVNSLSDYQHERRLLADYFPFNGPDYQNFCSAYLPFRELLQEFRISNPNQLTVQGLSFGLNGHTPYLTDTLLQQLTNGLSSDRERLHAFYRYVADRHLYFYAPDTNDFLAETYNASKFLNQYGYGHCGMIATGLSQLAHRYTGLDQRFWYVSWGLHGMSELRLQPGATPVCLDADQEGYYLLPDNRSLASFQDVYLDRYLYLRSKHFGKATPFRWDWNQHFNALICNGFHYYHHTDTLLNTAQPCCSSLNTRLGEDIRFVLPPTSSLSFLPNDTTYLHHYVQNAPAPDLSTVQGIIGTGRMEVSFTPAPGTISAGLSDQQHILVLPGDTVYRAASDTATAHLVITMRSPLVLHDGNFSLRLLKQNAADSVNIHFSRDSLQWTPLLLNAAVAPGVHNYDFPLLNLIQPFGSSALYRFYIRIEFRSSLGTGGILLERLKASCSFQFNKLNGPALRAGANSLQLYRQDTLPLNLLMKWTEDSSNHAPGNNINPVFPTAGGISDSSSFTFRWTPPTDADGDSIRDYQLVVSEYPDCSIPVSELFDRALFLTNGGKSFFTPEIRDYLSPNRTYYWRVRAQDIHGLWGDWSPTWSFQVKGPCYPKNLRWEFAGNNATDILKLTWDADTSCSKPIFFEVHGDNYRHGFFPADSSLLARKVNNAHFVHINSARAKHRVIAVDSLGNRSTPGYLINLPLLLVGNVGSPFDYISSVQAHIDFIMEPWPTLNVTDRALFCLVDTNALSQAGTQLTPLLPGFTKADICTRVGNDTVRVFQLFLKILPAGMTGNYHTYPGLLITPMDTAVVAQDNLVLNRIRYDGFLNGDSVNVLSSPATVSHGVTASSPSGYMASQAVGASSSVYRIVHQEGLIRVGTLMEIAGPPYDGESGFWAYPNPFRLEITVGAPRWIAPDSVDYRLCDLQGRTLQQGKLQSDCKITLNHQPDTGLYLLHLTLSASGKTQVIRLLHR